MKQINLQHKKKAMERTKRLLVDRNIDIALIQELYALGTAAPEMYGVPAGYTGISDKLTTIRYQFFFNK